MTNHNHKTASQSEFSNTKSGWFETCKCGATRLIIPGTFGINKTEWQ